MVKNINVHKNLQSKNSTFAEKTALKWELWFACILFKVVVIVAGVMVHAIVQVQVDRIRILEQKVSAFVLVIR